MKQFVSFNVVHNLLKLSSLCHVHFCIHRDSTMKAEKMKETKPKEMVYLFFFCSCSIPVMTCQFPCSRSFLSNSFILFLTLEFVKRKQMENPVKKKQTNHSSQKQRQASNKSDADDNDNHSTRSIRLTKIMKLKIFDGQNRRKGTAEEWARRSEARTTTITHNTIVTTHTTAPKLEQDKQKLKLSRTQHESYENENVFNEKFISKRKMLDYPS